MRIYLDHNATTPLRDEVVGAMTEVLRDVYGNPSSTHAEGAAARRWVEEAREQVAQCLGTLASRVYFTAGASEANNAVLMGLLDQAGGQGRLVTSNVEHPSVVEPAARLEKAGMKVTRIPVDGLGLLDPEAVFEAVQSDTVLVSLVWANNETGVVQPMEEIAEGLKSRGVPLHVDATQAVGKWPVDLGRVPADYLSCSAHKLNGPKGSGCLVAGEGSPLQPLISGGPQERRMRGGTENVAGIVGFGRACALASGELDGRMAEYAQLRDRLWEGLSTRVGGVRRNGTDRSILPNTLNVEFEGLPGEVILQALDLEGVAVSAGAACHSGSISPSHVLTAMGLSAEEARSSLRFSVGHGVDVSQIDSVIELCGELAARCRRAGSA
jgi:cysteine desulfurase